MKATRILCGAAVVAATMTLGAAAAAFPADLQMRPTAVPNSCDFSVFQPELRITNTGTGPLVMSSVFVEFAFNAPVDSIEAVHERITVSVFDANGGFVGWNEASVVERPLTQMINFAPNRRANQAWAVIFDPPDATGPKTVLIPPGGFVSAIPTLWRGGAAFDPECDDFTKVDPGTPYEFIDNQFMHLTFTSTQQLICEEKAPGVNDPNSGRAFFGNNAPACN